MRLIYEVGVNDADYQVNFGGKRCPYYARWKGMIERCYSEKYKNKYPSYKEVFCCAEWLHFSNFKLWMEKQDWQGKHLDKDLMVKGNQIYSPSTCVFIDKKVNYFLVEDSGICNELSVGVHIEDGEFKAQVNNLFTGKRENLGRYLTEQEAHSVWMGRKRELAHLLAKSEYVTCDKVRDALLERY